VLLQRKKRQIIYCVSASALVVSLQENQMEFVPGFKKWLHNTVAAEELHNKKSARDSALKSRKSLS